VTIRVVIADDHPVVLAGIAEYLSSERDLEIVARASNGEQALRAAQSLQPDILVLDLRMPVMDGLAVMRALRDVKPAPCIVVLTAIGDELAIEAVRLGAHGLLLKDTVSSQLVQCIREVHAGRKWLDHGVAMRALDTLVNRQGAATSAAQLLTRRELEIARMVAEGLPSKAIARKLSISEGTAKLHLHHVYEKLKLSGRVALVRYLRSQQLD
jgi:DNA-binding NarL/FixJ family response regulator